MYFTPAMLMTVGASSAARAGGGPDGALGSDCGDIIAEEEEGEEPGKPVMLAALDRRELLPLLTAAPALFSLNCLLLCLLVMVTVGVRLAEGDDDGGCAPDRPFTEGERPGDEADAAGVMERPLGNGWWG